MTTRNYFYWLRSSDTKNENDDENIFTMDDDEEIPSETDENNDTLEKAVQGDDEESESESEEEECESESEEEECESKGEEEECESESEGESESEEEILKRIYEKWSNENIIEDENIILNTCCCKRYARLLKKTKIKNIVEKYLNYKVLII